MGLRFHRPNKVTRGGPNVPLTPPDPRAIKPIAGDGNCFFRSVSYIITGSELQHMDVRRVILDHMKFIDYHPAGYTSAEQYIQATRMDKFGTWGTGIEMVTLAHMLQTCIFSYNTEEHTWHRYTPENLDRTRQDDLTKVAMYLRHPHNHFDVVLSTLQSWDSAVIAPPLLPSTTFSPTHTLVREQPTKKFVFTYHVQACIANYNMHTHTPCIGIHS